MWYTLRTLSHNDSEFVSAMTELLQSTGRTLILTLSAAYLAWYLLSADMWWGTAGGSIWLVSLILLVTCALALCLIRWNLVAAQTVWQVGLSAGIAAAMYVFRQPATLFLYALLPMMAVVTLGWPAGVVSETVMVIVVFGLAHSRLFPYLSSLYVLGTIFGGALTAILGWAAVRPLLTAMHWYLFSYEQARLTMDEARQQRVELKQTQEDLILANKEQARLSERLEAMYRVAEESRRAKEEFVANVSHELRTPLNMIIGFSEMIPKLSGVYGRRLPAALLSDMAAIQRNSQHLAKLVDDVLDLSQMEAGRMALSKEWASVQEIVAEAVQVVQPLYQSRGLSLEVRVPSDLQPVLCDSTRIRQVVINLLSNAGRFTDEGGVTVGVVRQDQELVFSVVDTGPGIAAEDQQRLFQPFEQLDRSIRRRHSGSGLGLSISKRFVEMHGGRMWLESEPGVGTAFHFSLPVALPAPIESDHDPLRWLSPSFEYQGRTRRSRLPVQKLLPRFVIMEPGDAVRRLFVRYWDDVEAVSVPDMPAALHELSRAPAQALIVNAPAYLGQQADIEGLANLPYRTPALVCWVPGEVETARRLGVVRYLLKPISHEVLLSVLADLGEGIRTVLLVDDEPEALQVFARMLSSAGHRYRVLQATNGHRALELLRGRRPDVMLLDLIMPGMDGFQVLQEKSKDQAIAEIPVVVISSRDPSGEPLVSDMLTVTRGGGLSARDLLGCLRAFSEVLAPTAQTAGRAQPEEPPE